MFKDSVEKFYPEMEAIRDEWAAAGLKMPHLVYWNVCARRVHFASNINHPNIQFVSGASISVIDSIMNGKDCDATGLMVQTLKKYSKIIESLRGVKYD